MQKMRKMKDSGIEWIGEIPEGWEVAKLKNIVSIVRGGSPRPIEAYMSDNDNDVNWIRISDTEKGSKYITHTSRKLIASGISKSRFIKRGSLILTNSMSFGEPYILDIDGCIHDGWVAFSDFKKIDKEFLYYFLTSPLAKIQFEQQVDGGVVKNLNIDKIGDTVILLPSLIDQNKVIAHLDSLTSETNSLLSKTITSIEEYKKLKQAVITQAVTKGVRGEREMKDSGVEWIGAIPKEWVCEKIKYATSISRGLFNHRPRNDERYYNGKYPFIQTGDVANATKYIVSYSQTLNELGKSVSKEFPKGTLTMTIAANVGDVAILNFDAYFPDSVVGFIPNKNIRTLYLFYIFSAMKDEFTRTAIKSTQLNLNIDRVKETFIPVTLNVNEQCEIENYLESKCAEIDGLIAKKEQLVKELENYKKSLIYEVVTGKREV
mgnify:FL=1